MKTRSIVTTMPGKTIAAICACMLLAGCTPKMDWRDVRQDNAGWRATFPGKPVEVSRKLVLGDESNTVTLTLKSARIDEVMYAVGWIDNTKAASAQKLQAAMLANIQAVPDSIKRKSITLQGHAAEEIEAQGLMRMDPAAAPVQARLWMRTFEFPTAGAPKATLATGKAGAPTAPPVEAGGRVIEIIVVGPASQVKVEDARQFLDSLVLL